VKAETAVGRIAAGTGAAQSRHAFAQAVEAVSSAGAGAARAVILQGRGERRRVAVVERDADVAGGAGVFADVGEALLDGAKNSVFGFGRRRARRAVNLQVLGQLRLRGRSEQRADAFGQRQFRRGGTQQRHRAADFHEGLLCEVVGFLQHAFRLRRFAWWKRLRFVRRPW
jgi:hypothetical protein